MEQIVEILKQSNYLTDKIGSTFHLKNKVTLKEEVLFQMIKRNNLCFHSLILLLPHYFENKAHKFSIISLLRTSLSDFFSLCYLLEEYNSDVEFEKRFGRLNASFVKNYCKNLGTPSGMLP